MASKPTPDASNAKPDASKPTPDAAKPKPDASKSNPDASKSNPDASKPKPDASKPKPDASKPKSGAPKPKSGASRRKRGATKSKKGASSAKKPRPPKGPDAPKTGDVDRGKEKSPEKITSAPAAQAKDAAPTPPEKASSTAKPPAVTPVASTTAPSAADQHEEKARAAKKTKLSGKDILVVATLLSFEIVYTLTEAWKTSFIYEDYESQEAKAGKINFFLSAKVRNSVLLVLTLLAIAAVALLTEGKKKLVYLIAGLCVYLITAVIGLLATNLNVVGLIDVMFLLQFGWTSVSALRYWFIFHQKFPLSVIQTRIVVTCSAILVGLTEYITAVWVSLHTFASMIYIGAWSIVLALMLICLGMVWVVKSYINTADDNVDVVKKRYSESGLLDSFNGRQTSQHLVLILCLIVPNMMMSMAKVAVSHIFSIITEELEVFAEYRIDLVVSLVCLPLVAGILIVLFAIRQEIRDLLVIGIAHFLNILFCAFFLVLIICNPTEEKDYPMAIGVLNDACITIIMHIEPENLDMIVTHENKKKYYSGFTSDSGFTYLYARNGSTMWVTGKFPNGTPVYDTKIPVTGNSVYYTKDKKLTKIKGLGELLQPAPGPANPILMLVSGLSPCGSGPKYDDNGTRIIFNNGCHSAKIKTSILELKERKNIVPEWFKNVPVLGELLVNPDFNISGIENIEFEFIYFVDGKSQPLMQNVSLTKDILDDKPYLVTGTVIDGDSLNIRMNVLPKFEFVDLPWPYRHAASISSGLSLSCFAIGVASASYIHFLWIQCPSKHRVKILAAFFGLNFVGSWIAQFLLTGLEKWHFLTLLIFQVVGGLWHLCATIVFNRKLRKLNDEEKKNIKRMQF